MNKLFPREMKLRLFSYTVVSLIIYYAIAVVVKLCGLDIFTLTDDLPILTAIDKFLISNVYLEDLFRSLKFTIEMFWIYGICLRLYDIKKLFIICSINFSIAYLYNLLIYFCGFPKLILSVVVPFVIIFICSFIFKDYPIIKSDKLKDTTKSVLTSLILFIILSSATILIELGLSYLKLNLIKFTYVETSIFNSILFSLDCWIIYFSVYTYCKILNKGE